MDFIWTDHKTRVWKLCGSLRNPSFFFFCIYWKIINWIFGFKFTVLVVKVARKAFSPFITGLHCMSLIDLDCDNNPGGTSLNKPYRFVPHQKVCFLCPYGLKTDKDFAHFGLVSGIQEYERRNREKYANSKWILRIFFVGILARVARSMVSANQR